VCPAHPSEGTVESSECKVIQEHLQATQFAEQEAADAQRRRESIDLTKQTIIRQREDETGRLATAETSSQDLEQRSPARANLPPAHLRKIISGSQCYVDPRSFPATAQTIEATGAC
jgi:hypothetical protein